MSNSRVLNVNGRFTQFVPFLRNRNSFDTHGSLSGRACPAFIVGRSERKYYDSIYAATYVVYSYTTPIAWFVTSALDVPQDQSDCTVTEVTDGYWVIPNTKYSVTTSRHQGRIRTALSVLHDSSY